MDGSHEELVKKIKKDSFKPERFKHIKTESTVLSDGKVKVHMTFLSSNLFGDSLQKEVEAVTDPGNCSVLSVVWLN
jgi:hypothetical protein